MTVHRKKRSSKSGLPPGTPVHIGIQKLSTMSLTFRLISEGTVEIRQMKALEDVSAWAAEGTKKWVTIHGVHDVDGLQTVAQAFSLHPLVVEDIVNTEQRPKIEDYGTYLFMTMKVVGPRKTAGMLSVEQISLVLSENFVLCFLEGMENPFVGLEERLVRDPQRLNRIGCDYLVYAHLDVLIDQYFPLLEQLGEEIDLLEERMIDKPDQKGLRQLHRLKRIMLQVRKAVWPLREVLSHMERGNSHLLNPSTHVFIRDAYDHVVQIIETTETYREMLGEMMEMYLSSLSNKLNETMKVLTVVGTIFIPLTFIVGIYGMNFKVMPELDWPWGYPAVMGVILLLAVVMLGYFRKKEWI